MVGKSPFKKTAIVRLRMEGEEYEMLQDLAALQSSVTGTIVSVQQLIRDAVTFTYEDNERLRFCFRRSRGHINRRIKKLETNDGFTYFEPRKGKLT